MNDFKTGTVNRCIHYKVTVKAFTYAGESYIVSKSKLYR